MSQHQRLAKRDEERQQSSEDRSRSAVRRTPLSLLEQRFMESGFEGFSDLEIAELLLSLLFPPRKSRSLAKLCIERFKDLPSLLTASADELSAVGLTPHCICGLKVLRELPAEILRQKIIEKPAHKSSKEIFEYLYYSMRDLKEEVFKVIYLNGRGQIIDTVDLFKGTSDGIPIRPREVVSSAMNRRSKALIFVHNHPSGDPTPSKSGRQFTRDLVFVGRILEIEVLDHIIIGANRYFSFADEGLIQRYVDDFLNIRIRGVRNAERNYLLETSFSTSAHH